MASPPLFLLLRGPVLVTAVVVALFYPSLSQVSVKTWVRLAILGVGLALSVFDVFTVVKERVRSAVRVHARSIVLDDMLRAIFDKEGMIAFVMSTMVGNATIYNFGNPEQRVRLVGSCLETDENDARTILTAPGGILKLFPDSVQKWLDQSSDAMEPKSNNDDKQNENSNTEQQPEHMKVPLHVEDDGDSSSNESDAEMEPRHNENHTVTGDGVSLRSAARERTAPSSQTRPPPSQSRAAPEANPPVLQSPEEVVAAIVKEILFDRIKSLSQSIPDNAIRNIGIVASAALALQLRSSPRTRQVVMGVLQGATAVTLAGVALGALAALTVKRNLFETERIRGTSDSSGHHDLFPVPLTSIWKAIRGTILLGRFSEWHGALAILVLFFVGRMRKKISLFLKDKTQKNV